MVVIFGIKIPESFYTEAEKLGIYLWGSEVISQLQMLDSNEIYSELCLILKFGKIIELFEEVKNADYLSPNEKEDFFKRIKSDGLGEIKLKDELANINVRKQEIKKATKQIIIEEMETKKQKKK